METGEAFGLAAQHFRSGRGAEAEVICREILAGNPDVPEVLHLLGLVRMRLGDAKGAVEFIGRAVQLRPDDADALVNFGNALRDDGKLGEAIAAFRRAIEIRPEFAGACNNLGTALLEDGQTEAAIEAYRNAVRIDPGYADAHYHLGNALKSQGELAAAIEAYERAIPIKPDMALAHWNLSWSLLLVGQFGRGWREYEWRNLARRGGNDRHFAQPQWRGEDLAGKTILLHGEQGLGDAIQFIRYAPLVAQRGARVVLLCRKMLARLFRDFPGVERMITAEDALPSFDVHCPLVSLPLAFGTDLNSIPAGIPYLKAEAELVEKWKSIVGKNSSELQVGLTWAGSPTNLGDKKRSIALERLAPLGDIAGVVFHSLQKGPAAAQSPPVEMKFRDHGERLEDLADTAALIANLDLVISVDTVVAHLAGAMGKPIWLLIPFDPDWRWMVNRNDSPWYPTMRIFRQRRPGEWGGPIWEMAEALAELTAKPSR